MNNPSHPMNASADSHWDAIVVGSGAGGLATALAAAARGQRVLLLEKTAEIGGTTAFSGGVVWLPAVGGASGEADALRYVQAVAGEHFDRARFEPYAKNARKALDFFCAETGLQYIPAWFPDYYQAAPGAVTSGRSFMPIGFDARRLGAWRKRLRPPLQTTTVLGGLIIPIREFPHFFTYGKSLKSFGRVVRTVLKHLFERLIYGRGVSLGNGAALVAGLLHGALKRGVEVRTEARVTSLVSEDGRVRGVRFEHGGQVQTAWARAGVVLACGGFPHDPKTRAEVSPQAHAGQGQASLAPASNTGDGIRLARGLGAAFVTRLHHVAAWVPSSWVPMPGGRMGFPHLRDRGKAGFLMVDGTGQRFTNEARSYVQVGDAMIRAKAPSGQIKAWLLTDAEGIAREGVGPVPPGPLPPGRFVRKGYLRRAGSLAELATAIGADRKVLERTIAEYNEGARQGEDRQFHRGEDAYQRVYGSPGIQPNPCVAPVATAPYYAIEVHLGDLGTFFGLNTDPAGRVLREDGSAIAGLYAVGNDMASTMGGMYAGAGITLGPALTYGYLIGHELASRPDDAAVAGLQPASVPVAAVPST